MLCPFHCYHIIRWHWQTLIALFPIIHSFTPKEIKVFISSFPGREIFYHNFLLVQNRMSEFPLCREAIGIWEVAGICRWVLCMCTNSNAFNPSSHWHKVIPLEPRRYIWANGKKSVKFEIIDWDEQRERTERIFGCNY
jgi:hypothetical protein